MTRLPLNNRQPPLNLHRQQHALAAGYSDREMAEAFLSIQLASFVDHFSNCAQTPFDVPTAAEAA
jgi:hypothetical protein